MDGMAQQPARLPREAVDHGDRIEISPPTRKRLVNVALGLVILAAGVWIAVIGPGDAAGEPLVRFGFGGVFALAGLAVLSAARRRVDLEATAATVRGVLGSRSIPWSRASEVVVQQEWRHTSSHDNRGGLRIGGRGSAGSHSRRVVTLRVRGGRDDRDITTDLGDASLAGGEALVGALRDRGWLPQEVAVSVEGGE